MVGIMMAGKQKMAVMTVAGVAIVGGIITGAYYGIYLPRQPETALKNSIANTLKLKQVSGKGSFSFTSKDTNSKPVSATYSIQADIEKGSSSLAADVTYDGAKSPVELRSIEKANFVRVGDLGGIKSLVAASSPESAPFVDQLSASISNQWIELDPASMQLLTKGDPCSASTFKLSEKDIDQIISSYEKSKIVVVKNTAKDTVDGRKVTKMELGFNKDNTENFAKDLEKSDVFKKLEKCGGDLLKEDPKASKEEKFKGTVSLVVWVDKSKKEIVKIAVDFKDDKATAKLDFTFNKNKVDIIKPAGAKSAKDIFGALLGGVPPAGAADAASAGGGIDPSQEKCQKAIQKIVAAGGDLSVVPDECQ